MSEKPTGPEGERPIQHWAVEYKYKHVPGIYGWQFYGWWPTEADARLAMDGAPFKWKRIRPVMLLASKEGYMRLAYPECEQPSPPADPPAPAPVWPDVRETIRHLGLGEPDRVFLEKEEGGFGFYFFGKETRLGGSHKRYVMVSVTPNVHALFDDRDEPAPWPTSDLGEELSDTPDEEGLAEVGQTIKRFLEGAPFVKAAPPSAETSDDMEDIVNNRGESAAEEAARLKAEAPASEPHEFTPAPLFGDRCTAWVMGTREGERIQCGKPKAVHVEAGSAPTQAELLPPDERDVDGEPFHDQEAALRASRDHYKILYERATYEGEQIAELQIKLRAAEERAESMARLADANGSGCKYEHERAEALERDLAQARGHFQVEGMRLERENAALVAERDRLREAAGICEHGNSLPDPDCGCGT